MGTTATALSVVTTLGRGAVSGWKMGMIYITKGKEELVLQWG
jgi:hypothetical protein